MWLSAAIVLLLTFSAFFTLSFLRDRALDRRAAENREILQEYEDVQTALYDVDQALADFLSKPGSVEISLLYQQLGDLKRTADTLAYNSPTRSNAKLLLAYAPIFKRIRDPEQPREGKMELLATFHKQRLQLEQTLNQESERFRQDTANAYAETTATRENLILIGGLLLAVSLILTGHWRLGRLQQETLRVMCEGTKALSRGDL
ncbi:MAG: hypothetical protein J6C30_07560 [Lentisphaeria bacterium]|nr:hypothetical protein [Lentisphaeria bacterium]